MIATDMSRIVYVGYELEDGRAPHQAMGALFLALHGHQVTYLTISNKPMPCWVKALPTLDYVTVGGPRRHAALGLARRLRRLLVSGAVDSLYVQGAQQALLCVWVPWIFPRLEIIYHTQDFKPLITPLYSRAERILARRSTQVICNEVNRAKVMELVHGLKQTPAVIRTALPARWPVPGRDEAMRTKILQHLPEDRRRNAVLLAVGGPYMSRRRSHELVSALAHLDSRYCLVFTGMVLDNPQYGVCRAQAETLGVQDRIVLLQRVGYYDLLALYAACDIGVLLYCDTDLANFYQGPGRVTEYLRAGIPFVTSDHPGLELLTLKYGVGAAARATDPADIARAVASLNLQDEAKRATRADQLRNLAQTTLAYDHDARSVFGQRFALRPEADLAAHPLWQTVESQEGLSR